MVTLVKGLSKKDYKELGSLILSTMFIFSVVLQFIGPEREDTFKEMIDHMNDKEVKTRVFGH